MPIALGYARQSLGRAGEDEDTSLSLDAQEQRIRAFADAERWTIADVIRDHDLRGWSMERPGWQRVVSTVEAGGIDAVMVFALSRVARDNLLQETAWRQLKGMGVRLISVTEPAAEDNLVRGILGVLGQAERERLGRYVSAAAFERQRRGIHIGGIPFGFRKAGEPGQRHRNIEPDPETAPIAREMCDRLLAGQTVFAIVEWLAASNVPTKTVTGKWAGTTLRRWFALPAIVGAVEHKGELLWDQFPGIVSRDEYEQMQRLLASTARVRKDADAETWLRGAIRHVCGRRMSAYRIKGRLYFACQDAYKPTAYRCTVRPKTVSGAMVERAAFTALTTDLATVLTPGDVIARWRAQHGGAAIDRQRATLRKRQAQVEDTHQRAESLYLGGRRDAAWLATQDGLYADAIRAITSELASLDTPPDADQLHRHAALLTELREALDAVSREQLQTMLRQLGHVVVDGRDLSICYLPDIAPLIPCPTRLPWRVRRTRVC